MFPPFDENGYLPKGIHDITWNELVTYFSFSPQRSTLLNGLENAIQNLKHTGCNIIYLDGSFTTNKLEPSDIDCCWSEEGVNFTLMNELYPEFLNLDPPRKMQKDKYKCEFFPANGKVKYEHGIITWLEFLQLIKFTNEVKGIFKLTI